jgi:transposase
MRRKSGRKHWRRNHRVDMPKGQWGVVEPMLPPRHVVGRPREVDLRRIINGIFYMTKTGAQWRHLPGVSAAQPISAAQALSPPYLSRHSKVDCTRSARQDPTQ